MSELLATRRTRPTVVVVVPYYNGSKFIERAVQSIYTQTVPADEVIIVNDGSNPEERIALGRLGEKYPFRIIDKENGGQGSARNAGVAASTSDFICFLDQDDFYLPNHVEDLTNTLPDNDLRFGFLYADLCVGDGDGNIIFADCARERGPHPKRSVIDLLSRDMFILPSASIIAREAFLAVGGFDPQFMGYEDDDLFLRLFRAGYSNHWLDKSVTVWCIHGESTSYSIRMVRSRFKYFKKLAGTFPDNAERGLYYTRDCLVPRFGRHFIEEVEVAIKKQSPHTPEIIGMLREFQEIVESNEYISDEYKKSLTRTFKALQGLPIPVETLSKYQAALRECYASTSWMVTRPLRATYRKLKGLPYVADTVPYEDDEAHKKFAALLESPSWRASAPLRIMKRLVSSPVKQQDDNDQQPKTASFHAA